MIFLLFQRSVVMIKFVNYVRLEILFKMVISVIIVSIFIRRWNCFFFRSFILQMFFFWFDFMYQKIFYIQGDFIVMLVKNIFFQVLVNIFWIGNFRSFVILNKIYYVILIRSQVSVRMMKIFFLGSFFLCVLFEG